MIRTQFIEEQLRHGRLDAKTLDNMFRRRIEEGANCSPFVSQAILATVKEVFSLAPEEANSQLALGQIKLLVVSAEEPAGKPLEQCQKLTVLLTLDAGQEDYQVRLAHGVEGLRRARILRVTAEARDQGGLLSYEDLAFRLFNCGVRTIVRDVQALRRRESRSPRPRSAAGHRPWPNPPRPGRASLSPGTRGQRDRSSAVSYPRFH